MSKHNRNREANKVDNGLIPNNAKIVIDDAVDNTGITLPEDALVEAQQDMINDTEVATIDVATTVETKETGEIIVNYETVEVTKEEQPSTDDKEVVIKDTQDTQDDELSKLLENVKNTGLENLYKLLHAAKNTKDILAILESHEPDNINDKLFIIELKDICTQLLIDTNESINKVNSRLYSVIINTIRNREVLRFDILNIIFAIDNAGFEPSNLLRAVPFTNEAKTLVNYQQLVTILEVLSNKKTRKANSSQISNFRHLTIGQDSIAFIKEYYKL